MRSIHSQSALLIQAWSNIAIRVGDWQSAIAKDPLMLYSYRVFLVLDNTVILGMLFFDIELICSRTRSFLWLKSKALHSRTKDGLFFWLSLVHFGMWVILIAERGRLVIDVHYFIYLQLLNASIYCYFIGSKFFLDHCSMCKNKISRHSIINVIKFFTYEADIFDILIDIFINAFLWI